MRMMEKSSRMHGIEFVIACLRVLRDLKQENSSGRMDNQVYLHISRDLEAIVEEVTVGLLR